MRKNDELLNLIVADLTRRGERMKIESACEGRVVTVTSEEVSGVSFYLEADYCCQGLRGWAHVPALFDRSHARLRQLLDKCQICPTFFLFVDRVDQARFEKLAKEFAERIFESACFYRQIMESCGERVKTLAERLEKHLSEARQEFYRQEAESLINESDQ